MKKIEVKTKTAYKLMDYSYLMDENLTKISGIDIFGHISDNYRNFVEIIEKGLKIPFKYPLGKQKYVDTKIQFKDKIYYTQFRFLSEITSDKEVLFLPEFKGTRNICLFLKEKDNKFINCNKISCANCILHKSNFKYTK